MDLGCGYRIVCIRKGERLVLLYIGTHDDCFRWIERRRTVEYDIGAVAQDAWIPVKADQQRPSRKKSTKRTARPHEGALMERIDDAMLRKVFSGIVQAKT